MFSKILIANRGEIAVRIIRACKEMGIATVAVFSDADRFALHTNLADESICIGDNRAQNSYLNINAIIQAAIMTKAGAIHPGYGFLSENSELARLCALCNIKFIGPSADIIDKMGDKDKARKAMKAANIPIIAGTDVLVDYAQAEEAAKKIGFPLLIKAKNGGGGKGIRLVDSLEKLKDAYNQAKAEAIVSFGDCEVYIEKYLSPIKHIEMQLLCDKFGNVVCLGERECSIQRNNQKLLEESPSPSINEDTRKKMIEYSVLAAKKIGYQNAGTIEYLMDNDNNFYFMEMNTRLQVEHPVSEMVTGYDIVKWQIRIAAGIPLNFTQNDVIIKGFAIECRINAENPLKKFMPSAGKITLYHPPGGPWVRWDSSLYSGYVVTPYYDSLIGKLIVFAMTRDEAIRKMQAALCELVIEGIEHNSILQQEILSHPEFKAGNYHTNFITKYLKDLI